VIFDFHINPETGCWVFDGCLSRAKYGRVKGDDGEWVYAHREMYVRTRGEIPDGWHLHHTCENTKCINPAHLEPLTAQDNIRRSRLAKLSHDKAEAIRSSDEPAQVLAKRYGVSEARIYAVRRYVSWHPETESGMAALIEGRKPPIAGPGG